MICSFESHGGGPSLWSLATLLERSRAFSSDLDSIYCVEPSKGSGRNKGHQDAVDLVRDWRLMEAVCEAWWSPRESTSFLNLGNSII